MHNPNEIIFSVTLLSRSPEALESLASRGARWLAVTTGAVVTDHASAAEAWSALAAAGGSIWTIDADGRIAGPHAVVVVHDAV